jgi:hypothetical protein
MPSETLFARAYRAYRRLLPSLSPGEASVLFFIMDRTTRYDITERAISIKEFLEGNWNSADELLTKAVACRKRWLHYKLKSLSDKGSLLSG